jgi:hypothetical protein
MGVVVAFRPRRQVEEDLEAEVEIDLLTAVDVAIRDLRDIVRRWGEESALEQAHACRETLEKAYDAAL